MKLESLQDLFHEELKDLYHAETQILKVLPKLARAATLPELKEAFEAHLEETKAQKERLEKVFQLLGMPVKGKTCEGMKGILAEGQETLDDAGDIVMDAALIAAANRMEHYEIAGYGCVRTYAQELGFDEVAALLQQTLDEEHAADDTLTELAVTCANLAAEAGTAQDEDEDEDEDEAGNAGEEEDAESRETAGVKIRTSATAARPKAASRRRDRAKTSR